MPILESVWCPLSEMSTHTEADSTQRTNGVGNAGVDNATGVFWGLFRQWLLNTVFISDPNNMYWTIWSILRLHTGWFQKQGAVIEKKRRADPGVVHHTSPRANQNLGDTKHFVELHSTTCDANVFSPKAAVCLLEKNIKWLRVAPLSESKPL